MKHEKPIERHGVVVDRYTICPITVAHLETAAKAMQRKEEFIVGMAVEAAIGHQALDAYEAGVEFALPATLERLAAVAAPINGNLSRLLRQRGERMEARAGARIMPGAGSDVTPLILDLDLTNGEPGAEEEEEEGKTHGLTENEKALVDAMLDTTGLPLQFRGKMAHAMDNAIPLKSMAEIPNSPTASRVFMRIHQPEEGTPAQAWVYCPPGSLERLPPPMATSLRAQLERQGDRDLQWCPHFPDGPACLPCRHDFAAWREGFDADPATPGVAPGDVSGT